MPPITQIKNTLNKHFPEQVQGFKVTGTNGTITIAWTDGWCEHMVVTAIKKLNLPETIKITYARTYTRAFVQSFLKEYEAWRGKQSGVTILGSEKAASIACEKKALKNKLNKNLALHIEKAMTAR